MSAGLPRHVVLSNADRPALVGERPVSYGDLDRAVDALAAGLRGLPVRAGSRAAIWMDKQPRYVEAILAALRAGWAYVPLDGRQPPARVQHVLTDAEPAVLFTDTRRLATLTEEDLPGTLRAIVLCDDGHEPPGTRVPRLRWAEFGHRAARPETPPPAEDDLAAILYTSGSTGLPKGVQITHGNLGCFIRWARRELEVSRRDVFANHASFNFDLSTFDLFVAMSVGAAVWIVTDAQARDVAALADGIGRHGVTVWYSVPSILHLLSASGAIQPRLAARLRYVLFAGEVFPVEQLRKLAGQLPASTVLYNLYGPTETNVCTYHRVSPRDLATAEPVPIGGPVPGSRLLVLDDDGQPVRDPGIVGELVVEGDCVTPGYWRRPAESAAAGHPSRRHATGDLVSLRDGTLIYRGRKDRMVKLSGFRVELGEIEAVAQRHPGIEEAAVVLREDSSRPRLGLYFSARSGMRPPTLLDVKRHCAAHLPTYMIPQAVSQLERLPRNANGKVDYRLLGADPAEVTRPAAESASAE